MDSHDWQWGTCKSSRCHEGTCSGVVTAKSRIQTDGAGWWTSGTDVLYSPASSDGRGNGSGVGKYRKLTFVKARIGGGYTTTTYYY